MSLSYKENYWESPELKSEFIGFLKLIHGLDLSSWDEAGYWDSLYRPFSYFDGDKLVASVCIYSMRMTVNGEERRVAQVSGVGTLPDYRRRGLSYDLSMRAIDWARASHEFFYLFADDEAVGLYEKCGFRSVGEYKDRISVDGRDAITGAVKLDVQRGDHLELIYRFALERVPVSDSLGVCNEKLLMFWVLNYLKDCVYHIPELDVLVLLERAEGVTTIFDIIGKQVPLFSEMHPYVRSESDESFEFLFMTDKLDLQDALQIEIEGNGTHVMGEFPFEDPEFIIPYTAKA